MQLIDGLKHMIVSSHEYTQDGVYYPVINVPDMIIICYGVESTKVTMPIGNSACYSHPEAETTASVTYAQL